MASERTRAGPTAVAAGAAWHTLSAAEVADRLGSDLERGLSDAEANHRLASFGSNALTPARGRSSLSILFAQFRSLIVVLLIAAAGVAFALGENIEAFAILVVILLNGGLGFLTEWKAERALTALRRQAVRVAHVVRGGVGRQVAAADLVPGDLVVLAAGARVPADGRVVERVRLQVEEAVLTGESQAVSKTLEPIGDPDAPLGDRTNMAFMGTTVIDGRGHILVTATGPRTEMGQIGRLIEEAADRTTPLEERISGLGRLLVVVVLALCGVIVVAGWLRGLGGFWHMLEVGISLAIAAVPEGLPAVTTMTLAIGMQRMARMRALIRRLPAVETLGSTTVICTDKTGTLTRNEMTVRAFVIDRKRIDVTGTGYSPAGTFRADGAAVDPRADDRLALALRVGALCNDARIERTPDGEAVLGDPTEAALIVAAEKGGADPVALRARYPRIGEVPFDSVSKRMATVHRTDGDRAVAFVKGSPAAVLAASTAEVRGSGIVPLTAVGRGEWEELNRGLAGGALRVLALAFRDLPDPYDEHDLGRELTFVGLVGMIDPLRDEAKEAIAKCRTAGIRTVMLTGDQQPTAAEIARQLQIDRDPAGRPLRTVHARELAGLDADGWDRAVADTAVFARVSPAHKLQIVAALQRRGHVVAMTGDGVNDAPALKKADIGIAMGIKGTEVAKESADMVITDDNFATIVGAVEQGRIIYANILRFIHYLFSCNVSEILAVFIVILIGRPLPFAALQLLWLNMITDIFPALALAVEPSSPDAMKRPPRDPKEPLLDPRFIGLITWQGLLLAAVTLIAFEVGLRWYGSEADGLRRAGTMAFLTLALSQVLHAFNARSQKRSLISRLFTNGWLWSAVAVCILLQVAAVTLPPLQQVLHTVWPTSSEWLVIVACSLAPIVVVEAVKAFQPFSTRVSANDDPSPVV